VFWNVESKYYVYDLVMNLECEDTCALFTHVFPLCRVTAIHHGVAFLYGVGTALESGFW